MDQARNSKKKKKIKMGKLLQFPVDRVKRPVPEIEITDVPPRTPFILLA